MSPLGKVPILFLAVVAALAALAASTGASTLATAVFAALGLAALGWFAWNARQHRFWQQAYKRALAEREELRKGKIPLARAIYARMMIDPKRLGEFIIYLVGSGGYNRGVRLLERVYRSGLDRLVVLVVILNGAIQDRERNPIPSAYADRIIDFPLEEATRALGNAPLTEVERRRDEWEASVKQGFEQIKAWIGVHGASPLRVLLFNSAGATPAMGAEDVLGKLMKLAPWLIVFQSIFIDSGPLRERFAEIVRLYAPWVKGGTIVSDNDRGLTEGDLGQEAALVGLYASGDHVDRGAASANRVASTAGHNLLAHAFGPGGFATTAVVRVPLYVTYAAPWPEPGIRAPVPSLRAEWLIWEDRSRNHIVRSIKEAVTELECRALPLKVIESVRQPVNVVIAVPYAPNELLDLRRRVEAQLAGWLKDHAYVTLHFTTVAATDLSPTTTEVEGVVAALFPLESTIEEIEDYLQTMDTSAAEKSASQGINEGATVGESHPNEADGAGNTADVENTVPVAGPAGR